MRAVALIPAGPGEDDLAPLAGHPLLAHAVAAARRLAVARAIVLTANPRHAEIARAYGAEVPFLLAPGEAATAAALETRGMAEAAAWLHLDPAFPFLDPDSIVRALALLRDRAEADGVCLVAAEPAPLRGDAAGWIEPAPPALRPTGATLLRHGAPAAPRLLPLTVPGLGALSMTAEPELVRALATASPRAPLLARHLHLPPEPPEDPRAALPYAELEQVHHAADPAARAALLAAVMRREAGSYSQTAVDLARFDPPPLLAACEAILREAPVHRVALRTLAWLRGRLGDADGARAALARLLEAWPDQGLDTKRELLRLHLLGTHDAPAREGDWRRHGRDRGELSRLCYLAQRAAAEGTALDHAPFEAELARRAAEAFAEASGTPAAPALALLRDARSVALVGNGPALKGSRAATAIEAHGLVVRLNYPVMLGHEADVGTRTDLVIFDGSHRPRVAERMRRHPAFPAVPALGTHAGPMGPAGPLYPGPPDIPLALMRLVCDLSYTRLTTGMAALVLAGVVLGKPVTLFGFDFFRPGGAGHYYDAAAAPFTHETGYERFYVERVLPVLRPQIRWVRPT